MAPQPLPKASADDSRTLRDDAPAARVELVAALAAGVARLSAAGDLVGARLAADALARLLGAGERRDDDAGVVDLEAERRKRGGR